MHPLDPHQPLLILHLEDSPCDRELVRAHLEAQGFEFKVVYAKDRREFEKALEHYAFDLILTDFSLPSFDGMSALERVHGLHPETPFIFVSGTIGEERAVESLKSGATDYVLKDHLHRLGAVIRRALREAKERADRLRAEAALRISEHRLKLAVHAFNIGMWECDLETRRVYLSPELKAQLGHEDHELHNAFSVWEDRLHPEDREQALAKLKAFIAEPARGYETEFRLRHKNGTHRWIYSQAKLFPDATQGAKRVIGCHLDITERKRLEEQFIQAQKMEVVGQLASGVAHDFNNILAIIMGYADLIAQELEPGHALRAFGEEIRNAAERAAALTRQLLVFSRKQTLQPIVLDPNGVLMGMKKMLRRLVDESIELAVLPGPHVGRVRADSGYLGQVLLNLVVNARDAMPQGGQLTLETADVTLDEHYVRTHPEVRPGEYVMFAVSDTGTGMMPEVLAHIFEPFFTTKAKGQGTGLGLSTCQTIVKQCGGHIGVYTEPGKGTTFKVYLPRVDEPLDHDTTFINAGPLPHGTETVLLVEDDSALRQLAANVLGEQGYTVLRATNGQDGLRVARAHRGPPIRLVVTDVIMPQMNGKVMAEWLKATYPDLKVLFTSGYTDAAIARHGVLDPGVEFLAKPYTPAALTRKVRDVLDAPK